MALAHVVDVRAVSKFLLARRVSRSRTHSSTTISSSSGTFGQPTFVAKARGRCVSPRSTWSSCSCLVADVGIVLYKTASSPRVRGSQTFNSPSPSLCLRPVFWQRGGYSSILSTTHSAFSPLLFIGVLYHAHLARHLLLVGGAGHLYPACCAREWRGWANSRRTERLYAGGSVHPVPEPMGRR